VAKFCNKYFGATLQKNLNKYTNVKEALTETFFDMDKQIEDPANYDILKAFKNPEDAEPNNINGGCTANVVLIINKKIYCANAGDSRCYLFSGKSTKAMSTDHKPEDEGELKRIKGAGGEVTMGRINFGLNLSRAIGDLDYKKNLNKSAREQMVICEPDIEVKDITGEDEFLVIGCDGIWELQSGEQVCNTVEEKIQAGETKLSNICEFILDKGLAPTTGELGGLGCDNMSIVVVQLPKVK